MVDEGEDVAFCADGCGAPATTERFDGMVGADLLVELVCEACKVARP